ncbi:hypothetical protein JCM11641_006521 [Rhodosporidiobolus odoratus]
MPLHRRTSSAALYQPLSPVQGVGDVTDELDSYSSATPRPRTGSFVAQQRALAELEEKEGFIPQSAYDLPGSGSSGRRGGRGKGGLFGWKSKLVLLTLLGGGVGASVFYLFYQDTGLWWEGSRREEVQAWQKTATSKVASAATGVANYAVGAKQSAEPKVYDEEDEYSASQAEEAEEEEYESTTYEEDSEDEEDQAGSDSSLSGTSKKPAFSASRTEAVTKMLDNGTFAAYRWHETLLSLNRSTKTASTIRKADGGRLVVVGDLHGTHTSLLRLLKRLSFSPSSHGDTLLHTGDILAKSPLDSSLTTISLLRRLGAKGVRGNHDQKVIEWRKWMEAYGPLNLNSSSSSSSAKAANAIKGVQNAFSGRIGSSDRQADFRSGARVGTDENSRFRKIPSSSSPSNGNAAKLGAPAHPREKAKRGWMDWITGSSENGSGSGLAGDATSEELMEEQSEALGGSFVGGDGEGEATWADEDAVQDGPSWGDLRKAAQEIQSASSASVASRSSASSASVASRSSASASASASSSSTSATTTGGGRKPFAFGRPTTLSSSSHASSRTTSSSRPSSTSYPSSFSSTTSGKSSSNSGPLLGPAYSWLSPSLSSSELEDLGVEVPEGWEWGGDHWEIARHLTEKDMAYLESLPLTLWVEEIKSWVVHAGMVPWHSLSTTLSRLPSTSSLSAHSALPSLLTSSSPLSFSPSTSLARLLSHQSSRTALLLEPLNTDPFTLLNMRTLHSSSSSSSGGGRTKIKGPATEWAVSSKGKKASRGSRPWWSVWEEGIKECAARNNPSSSDNEDEESEAQCEEVGIVYGHWAGQGLQVQDHSIGLDSGCVHGRRLSALVVPLSGDTNSTGSPLSTLNNSRNTSSASASRFASPSSATVSSSSTAASRAAQKNWHGGLNRVTRTSSSPSSATSSATNYRDEEDEDEETTYHRVKAEEEGEPEVETGEETVTGGKSWWKPWKKLSKRAPPQGRPGVAPWEAGESVDAEQEMEGDGDGDGDGWEEEESTTTVRGRGRGRPTSTATSVSSSSPSTGKERGKWRGRPTTTTITDTAASSTRLSGSSVVATTAAVRKRPSFLSSSSFAKSDEEEEEEEEDDDDDESAEVAELAAAQDDAEEEEEGAFTEQEVKLAQLGAVDEALRAWVVSVDCSGEIEVDTE